MKLNSPAKKDIAVVAITRKGVALARRLSPLLSRSCLYLAEKFAAQPKSDEHTFSSPTKEIVREVFSRYHYLVLVMAVGIAVRLVASELKDKRKDPGVVVVDDSGSFSVSLLSGHIGGANRLAQKIASLIGAQPVITTASEVSQTIAVDLMGKEYGWEFEDNRSVTAVSAALVNEEPVGIYQDAGERNWWSKIKPLPDNVRIFATIKALARSNSKAGLIITDRILDNKHRALLPHHTVTYHPKSLVIGIGCNRGTQCTEIEAAVSRVLSKHGLATKSIRNIATITLKKKETGLLEFARKYCLPVQYFDKEALCKVNFSSSPSAVALRHVGTPAVCEAAALLSSGSDSLIVRKVKYNRAVTVAVARAGFNDKKEKRGKLFLVGIGPGNPEHMTFKAKEAIDCSEVVVGYKTYITLIEPYLAQKEIIATGMGAEIERVKTAISLAKKGKIVSLISSGDTGIYGMAGLVGEILSQQSVDDVDIQVIPGVPLLAAGATLLGAPITSDFAAISLSDYLVPWKEIKQKLKLSAQGNFIIVIHNPKSKSRKRQLAEAREIILRYRPTSTPVGIVTNAYRQKQEVVITNLEHMFDYEIGMNTIIIIGNSATFTLPNWIVTPRGYRIKYDLEDSESKPRSTGN